MKMQDTNSKGDCSLHVLGFPSNQFYRQEPGKEEEILNCLQYVRPGKGYIPTFDMFSKVEVNGKDAIPLYKWLKYMCPRPTNKIAFTNYIPWTPVLGTDIEWNFEEFLIDHKGQPIRRFSADTLPLEFEKDISDAIDACQKNMSQ